MNAKDRMTLLRSGYAVDAAGAIECHREPLDRWRHTHLSSVRLTVADTKAAATLISAIIAAVSDEPGEILIGTSKTDVVLLFKLGSTYNVEVSDGGKKEHEFVFQDAPCLFIATARRATIATADYTWKDGSPLTTRLNDLAPLYPNVSHRAYDAVSAFLRENGGRWGPLVIPKNLGELHREKVWAEIAARKAAGIVAGDPQEIADEKLVAAHPDLRQTDGAHAGLVVAARARIAARKEAAREEARRLKQEEKAKQARFAAMAEHVGAEAT
jgi:hypothetical protein